MIKFYMQKPLSDIAEEAEQRQLNVQGDLWEAIAEIGEELLVFDARLSALEKQIVGGGANNG
ncbi:transcription factor [Harryflintia acetispora]|uniref:transcription factor n=1 Tax=Harryflintia acetispora TaxID=1849041 RepID=UPI00189BE5AD|nr:transcription factor [Harryflintia acetispora]